MIDKSKLKELAMKATPGEWLRDGRTVYALQHAGWKKGVEQFENRFYCGIQHGRGTPEIELEANAAFIAAANPATILELLSELDRVETAASDLIGNAAVIGDPRYGGSTDCYAVPLDDIDTLREAITTTTSASVPAPSAKQEPSEPVRAMLQEICDMQARNYGDGVDTHLELITLCDKARKILAAPSASASSAAPVAQDEAHQARLTLIRALGDQELIEAVRHGRVSISAALAKVVGAAPVAGSQQVPTQFTEKQIAAAARFMSDSSAAVCCVDKDDNWKLYGDSFAAEFKGALAAALAAAPAVPVPVEQGWISITERLPELYVAVALLNEGRWMNTGCDADINWQAAGWLCEHGQKYWSVIGETRAMTLESVTHWMPLPAAPSLQQGKEGAGDE